MSNYINMNETVDFFKELQKHKDTIVHRVPTLMIYGPQESGKTLFAELVVKALNLNTLIHQGTAGFGKFEKYAVFEGAELFILDDIRNPDTYFEVLKELSTSKTLPCDAQMVGRYNIRNSVRGIICLITGPLDPNVEDRRAISTNIYTAFHALAASVRR